MIRKVCRLTGRHSCLHVNSHMDTFCAHFWPVSVLYIRFNRRTLTETAMLLHVCRVKYKGVLWNFIDFFFRILSRWKKREGDGKREETRKVPGARAKEKGVQLKERILLWRRTPVTTFFFACIQYTELMETVGGMVRLCDWKHVWVHISLQIFPFWGHLNMLLAGFVRFTPLYPYTRFAPFDFFHSCFQAFMQCSASAHKCGYTRPTNTHWRTNRTNDWPRWKTLTHTGHAPQYFTENTYLPAAVLLFKRI